MHSGWTKWTNLLERLFKSGRSKLLSMNSTMPGRADERPSLTANVNFKLFKTTGLAYILCSLPLVRFQRNILHVDFGLSILLQIQMATARTQHPCSTCHCRFTVATFWGPEGHWSVDLDLLLFREKGQGLMQAIHGYLRQLQVTWNIILDLTATHTTSQKLQDERACRDSREQVGAVGESTVKWKWEHLKKNPCSLRLVKPSGWCRNDISSLVYLGCMDVAICRSKDPSSSSCFSPSDLLQSYFAAHPTVQVGEASFSFHTKW